MQSYLIMAAATLQAILRLEEQRGDWDMARAKHKESQKVDVKRLWGKTALIVRSGLAFKHVEGSPQAVCSSVLPWLKMYLVSRNAKDGQHIRILPLSDAKDVLTPVV